MVDYLGILDPMTDIQKFVINKGLCDYQYIMNHWDDKDSEQDFQKVYYNFYLKSGYVRINKGNNKKIYFDQMRKNETDLLKVVETLHRMMCGKSYEFSFATKL